MVELAIAGEEGLELVRIEIERDGPSYTVDTLEALQAKWPEAELTLLLGADAAAEFPAWRSADRIRELARVVMFSRPGAVMPVLDLPCVDLPAVEISSTRIRERVLQGRSIRYLVPEAVAAYVAEHRLYQDHRTTGP
jgi:nicotinate-nucleotide adenylyltransferase